MSSIGHIPCGQHRKITFVLLMLLIPPCGVVTLGEAHKTLFVHLEPVPTSLANSKMSLTDIPSIATMQVASQHTQAPVSTGTYAVDHPPTSRHQYLQQSPQAGDTDRFQSSPRTINSPQPSSGGSKRPSNNAPLSDNPDIYHQDQSHSPGSYASNTSTPRHLNVSNAPVISPVASKSSSSPSYQSSRREQRAQQEQLSGPPIPPPPRTSSSQKSQSAGLPLGAPLTDRNTSSRSQSRAVNEGASSSRNTSTREIRQDRTRVANELEQEPDASSASASVAQSRRRGPTSPDGLQRATSTRETGLSISSNAMQSRSASHVGPAATTPTKTVSEEEQIINRVVVTDPEIDLQRERERQAEATSALSLVVSGGTDDGGRSTGRSRQDYSASASRRKETKFGDYILGQTLGEGEFGKVKLGWKKDGSVQVAIKLIRRESLGTNPSRLPKIYREISILRGLSHPNIVRLHEMAETDRYIGIILEYASGGELFDFILNHRYLKDNNARRLFAQLVSGVGYLHKKGIVHRDLKLENLLLDRNRNIIITDFGFANTFDPRDELTDEIEYHLADKEFVKRLGLERIQANGSRKGDLMQTSCGSPCYAAPELVVTDSLYTGRKVDVWSCGVILVRQLCRN